METSGAIIMLAWPVTPAIQVNSWYEPIMRLFGFNKNGYYKVGHSAIVLVEPKTGKLHYFDFGRYHTPAKYGRVRSSFTDPDLTIKAIAKFNPENEISNSESLLLALSNNKSFHGKGNMYASINYKVNFHKALLFANNQQYKEIILYGPFAYKGTNCSRFTSRVFRSAINGLYKKVQTILPLSLTQTPIGNVLIASTKNNYYKVENNFVHKYTANIFTFFAHWTIPPIKAIPITFNKKKSLLKNKVLVNFYSKPYNKGLRK